MIFWNFEFGINGQFSVTDYSKTIRRRKKNSDNKRLLIVWTFHKNMKKNCSCYLSCKFCKCYKQIQFFESRTIWFSDLRTKNVYYCVSKVVWNFWSEPIHSFRNIRIYRERWPDLSRFVRPVRRIGAFKRTKWLVFPRLPIPSWVFLFRFNKQLQRRSKNFPQPSLHINKHFYSEKSQNHIVRLWKNRICL